MPLRARVSGFSEFHVPTADTTVFASGSTPSARARANYGANPTMQQMFSTSFNERRGMLLHFDLSHLVGKTLTGVELNLMVAASMAHPAGTYNIERIAGDWLEGGDNNNFASSSPPAHTGNGVTGHKRSVDPNLDWPSGFGFGFASTGAGNTDPITGFETTATFTPSGGNAFYFTDPAYQPQEDDQYRMNSADAAELLSLIQGCIDERGGDVRLVVWSGSGSNQLRTFVSKEGTIGISKAPLLFVDVAP